MAITTYAELKTSIADWLLRDDLTSVIPSFISLAEAQMNRSLAHWRQETRSEAEIDARYSELPADWLSPIRLSVSTSNGPTELEPMSYSEMLDARTRSADVVGIPKYYSISAGSLEVYPTPSGAFDVTMLYSYTNLTLPTSEPGEIPVGAGRLKKQKKGPQTKNQ